MNFQNGLPQAQAQPAPLFPQSPDPTLSDPKWLEHLSSHPIFVPSDVGPKAAESANAINPRLMAVRNTDLILVVNNEIRMASLLDAKASHTGLPVSPSPSTTHAQSSYKVITPSDPAHLDFDIKHILVNPTGKLLVLVGERRIALIVLPRAGFNKQVGPHVTARSAPIAPYYHSTHGFTTIAKVQWHPWGEAGTSLLVLTDDALLREYDVSRDTEEPKQTASFLPSKLSSGSARSRSRSATPTAASLAASMRASPGFSLRDSPSTSRQATSAIGFGVSAEDDDSQVAVSFSLCIGSSSTASSTVFDEAEDEAWAASMRRPRGADDWSPFTVFGLMKNGDIWAICPFMPKTSMVSPSYIHALSRFTSLKLSSTTDDDQDPESQFDSEMQLRFLNSLLKQVGDKQDRSERQPSRSRASATPGLDRYSRERSTSAMDLDILSEPPGVIEEEDEPLGASHDVPLRLHPPTWAFAEGAEAPGLKNAPRPQGPFLLRPAPIELCDERESSACDISWTWLDKPRPKETDTVQGIGTLAIVGHDGRVDIGILLESVEAKWGKPQQKALRKLKSTKPFASNRYGLSDTEDETDDGQSYISGRSDAGSLPTLLMYETIDLGLLDSVTESSRSDQAESSDTLLHEAASHRPCFVADPLYRDTLYVYHALGAQCLGLGRWAGKLIDALNLPSEDDEEIQAPTNGQRPATETREKALTKLLHYGETTEVVWIVKTVASSENADGTASINPVIGLCILSDIYLSYSLLAVTRDLQLVAIELSLRVQSEQAEQNNKRSEARRNVMESAGRTQSYVSLLGDGPPFNPPALFNQNGTLKGLPSQPRRAAATGSTPSSAEIKVTPDTLRQLGKTVETFRGEIRDVVQAGNVVQARLDLQVREMTRMLEKLAGIRKRSEKLLGSGGKEGLEARLKRVAETQSKLTARTDKALQRLMDRHQPSLSIYEKRWFDELERISAEVGVEGGASKATGDGKRGLVAKASQIDHHLCLLRPSLEALAERKRAQQAEAARTAPTASRGLGREQLQRVEKLLTNEAGLLAEAKDKITDLNGKIAKLHGLAASEATGGRGLRGSSVF